MLSNHVDGVPKTSLRRRVSIHGEWTLMIELCEWELQLGSDVLAGSDLSHPRIDRALRVLQVMSGRDVADHRGAVCASRGARVSWTRMAR